MHSSSDKIAYAIDVLRKYGIVETAETKALGIGAMSEARWKRFYDDMVAAGAQPRDSTSSAPTRCGS